MSDVGRQSRERFVALDLHKSYAMVGAVDRQQQVVLSPRRVPLHRLAGWAEKHLEPTDVAVLEAGANAWSVHDLLKRLVDKVTVVHPYHVKLIASSMVKTDKIDTLILARLLAAGILPEIWVPPMHVRELRSLVSHRRRLVKQRSAAKNRLHSILHRHSVVPAPGDLFSASNRSWWDSLSIPSSERLRARQDLSIIDHLNVLVTEVEGELAQLSQSVYWEDQVPFLVQLPGIGMLSAMTILGAIGDVARFPNAKKLVGYSGLGARVHHSGSTRRGGGITKQGRRELRTVMVECAWVAARRHPHWQSQFARLAKRIGKQKAIVAIARKLLVVVWHVLTKQAVDHQAEVPAVARSLMNWGAKHSLATGLGMSRAQFVRQALDQLGTGDNLTAFKYCGRTYNLPETVPKVTPA
jgi:transposase